jgi:hypothetical protein
LIIGEDANKWKFDILDCDMVRVSLPLGSQSFLIQDREMFGSTLASTASHEIGQESLPNPKASPA